MDITEDVLAGKWMQIKGHLKEWHGDLVHNKHDQILGRFEVQVGLLRERSAVLTRRVRRVLRAGRERTGTA